MKPTMELRWIEKDVIVREFPGGTGIAKTEKVLQQKWEGYNDMGWIVSQWRDIPIEEETQQPNMYDLEGRN